MLASIETNKIMYCAGCISGRRERIRENDQIKFDKEATLSLHFFAKKICDRSQK